MIQWIKQIFKGKAPTESDFELVFSHLRDLAERDFDGAKRTYELLRNLNSESAENETEELIHEFKRVRFASNANSVFHFYFPIISHLLFHKLAYEKEVLGRIIGPIFAMEQPDAEGMIKVVQGSMKYQMKENPHYLTKEGQSWVINQLPEMKVAVQREIDILWEELGEEP